MFSARKLPQGIEVSRRDVSLVEDEEMEQEISPVEEDVLLTKTDRYTVTKLDIEEGEEDTSLYRGNVGESGFIAVVDDENVCVSNIKDKKVKLAFPYESNPLNLKPFVVLIDDLENPLDSGIVIIDSYTGDVRYYESIVNAPLLKVLNLKIFELNLGLKNEFINLVEYIPELGIICSTSSKKVINISLKDTFGKPSLSKLDIIAPSSFNLLSFFNNDKLDIENFNTKNRIVSILQSDDLIIQESEGIFESWKLDGVLVFQYKVNLKPTLSEYLSDVYERAKYSFKILDLVSLPHIASDCYLLLTSFDNEDDVKLKNLVLFTVKINRDGVLIYSTYKLTCYHSIATESPKLVLPKPYNICYIITNNSVVLTEVLMSLDPLKLALLNYKAKWEDIISFKNSVKIVGYNVDDKNRLIVVTSNSGLLKVENSFRLDDSELDEIDLNLKLQQEPMLFIKSRIEQAIYFGSDDNSQNPLVFEVPQIEDFKLKDIEQAISSVLEELILNESKFLPKIYPSVDDFLVKRNQFLQTLTQFILANFKEISVDLKISILNLLNKFKISQIFYSIIKNDSKLMELTRIIIDNISKLELRDFFFNNLNQITELIDEFLKNNKDDSKTLQLISEIGVSYMNFEKNLRYDDLKLDTGDYEFSSTKPFLIENEDLLLTIVQFYNLTLNNKDSLNPQQQEQVVVISEFLFYSFNDMICYSQFNTPSNGLNQTYLANKSKWISVLNEANLQELVLNVSEKFQDMTSIVEILLIENRGDQFDYYFDKFGYKFASNYYKYLIDHKQFSVLFSNHTSHLSKFFQDNDQYNWIRWIYYLQIQEYEQLSKVLSLLNEDSISNKQFNLSLLKLSLLAIGGEMGAVNYQLKLCQYQLEMEIVDCPATLLSKLQMGKPLSEEELIDLLLSMKSSENFAKCYDIVRSINDYEEFKLMFTKLVLQDDWTFLEDENKTDEFLNEMIKSTVTFKTIKWIIENVNEKFQLDLTQLKGLRTDREDTEDLEKQLTELDQRYQLNEWVQSIISLSQ